jgi:hypothetical protein
MPSAGVPPVIPPQLPTSAKRGLTPLAITAICVAVAAALFLAVALIAVGIFGARMLAHQNAPQSPQARARQDASAKATAAQTGIPARREVRTGATKSEPGLSYKNEIVASEPWSIHVLKIERSRKDLTFYSAHARDKVLAVSFIADQARAVPRELGRAIAGVNGDFYLRDNATYAGDPRGLQIVNGELISGPDTVCVWFDADENPHLDEVKDDFQVTWPNGQKTPFGLNQQRRANLPSLYTPTYGPSTRASGSRELVLEKDGNGPWLPLQASQTYRARVREISANGNTRLVTNVMVLSLAPQTLTTLPELKPGMVLQISTATTPDLKGVKAAMGGGPALVKDGKPIFTQKTAPPGVQGNWSERSKYERHPRTAIGWSPTHVYFVIVDGRQPGLSMGMMLAELSEYFVNLGCTEAMNLDGGKSAQMWLNGQIMNSPCQGEDTVASSLLVVRKP